MLDRLLGRLTPEDQRSNSLLDTFFDRMLHAFLHFKRDLLCRCFARFALFFDGPIDHVFEPDPATHHCHNCYAEGRYEPTRFMISMNVYASITDEAPDALPKESRAFACPSAAARLILDKPATLPPFP